MNRSRPGIHRREARSRITPFERDVAYAKRALAVGEPEDVVIAAIAIYHRYDQHDPQGYAELVIRSAAQQLSEDVA